MTTDMSGLPEKPEPPSSSAHLSKYRPHLAHLDMSESAKDELLNVVWRIMGNFVDRAFCDDPVQHVNEIRKVGEVRSAPVVGLGEVQSKPNTESLSSAFIPPAAGWGRKERS